MRIESEILLTTIQDACVAINAFVHGTDFAAFTINDMIRSGVCFKFVMIGEALTKLKTADETVFDAIHESWRIVGFRNQIVHGYADIRDEITWRVIEQKLPRLKQDVDRLLRDGESSEV